jgi:hypothetical protein
VDRRLTASCAVSPLRAATGRASGIARDGDADVAGSGEAYGRMSIAEKSRLVNESLQRMVTMLAGLVHDDDSKGNAVILQDRMHGIGRHGGAVSRADDDGGLLDDGRTSLRSAVSCGLH